MKKILFVGFLAFGTGFSFAQSLEELCDCCDVKKGLDDIRRVDPVVVCDAASTACEHIGELISDGRPPKKAKKRRLLMGALSAVFSFVGQTIASKKNSRCNCDFVELVSGLCELFDDDSEIEHTTILKEVLEEKDEKLRLNLIAQKVTSQDTAQLFLEEILIVLFRGAAVES